MPVHGSTTHGFIFGLIAVPLQYECMDILLQKLHRDYSHDYTRLYCTVEEAKCGSSGVLV